MAEFVLDSDTKPGARPTEAPQQGIELSSNVGEALTESLSTSCSSTLARGQPHRRRTHLIRRRKVRSPCHGRHKPFAFNKKAHTLSHAQRMRLRQWVQPFIRPML